MSKSPFRRCALAIAALALAACSGGPSLPIEEGYGANPTLPAPRRQTLPLVNIAPAEGWAEGEQPTPAQGLSVNAFATGLDHPRWLYVLPNGDVLVAETNAPSNRTERERGIRAFFMRIVMRQAGAATPSADRITLLRDGDGDGAAETRTIFLQNLHSPFGMTLVGDTLYVANTNGVVSFPYSAGQTEITAQPNTVVALPAGARNHHWTKNLIASPDGARLYATVGSNSNVAEHGMEVEEGRAAIWEIDRTTGEHRIFASGLRNPNGMDWEPMTGVLWTVVNERDEIGNDLVPDYMTSVSDGGFYGWPYFYWGDHRDDRIEIPANVRLGAPLTPDYALGSHTASLGLAFNRGNGLGEQYRSGVFIGQHGSWNRAEPSGYKVVYVPFANGRPSGQPQDVLTGFLDADENARGRPVGVAFDRSGALLVADDVGNVIWRVRRSER
jgi:glucose/arabinose dehydrogenase